MQEGRERSALTCTLQFVLGTKSSLRSALLACRAGLRAQGFSALGMAVLRVPPFLYERSFYQVRCATINVCSQLN